MHQTELSISNFKKKGISFHDLNYFLKIVQNIRGPTGTGRVLVPVVSDCREARF